MGIHIHLKVFFTLKCCKYFYFILLILIIHLLFTCFLKKNYNRGNVQLVDENGSAHTALLVDGRAIVAKPIICGQCEQRIGFKVVCFLLKKQLFFFSNCVLIF